jgi:hypothetical protein
MNKLLLLSGIAGLMAITASAGTINYDTDGSTLSCGTAASCVQDTASSVTLDGTLTLSYNAGSGVDVITPSIINFGNIISTGTGSALLTNGLVLSINVDSTPPGTNGSLPNGSIAGQISTSSSGAIITFSPNNTTTSFGTLPGVVISGGGVSVTYQVLQTSLGLQAPTIGNPVGQTTIQGAVTSTGTPEPGSILLLSTGLIGCFMARKRLS